MGVVEYIYLLMLLRIRDLTSQTYMLPHITSTLDLTLSHSLTLSLYLNECNDKHFSAVALSDKYTYIHV